MRTCAQNSILRTGPMSLFRVDSKFFRTCAQNLIFTHLCAKAENRYFCALWTIFSYFLFKMLLGSMCCEKYRSQLARSANYFILVQKFPHSPSAHAGFLNLYEIACFAHLLWNILHISKLLSPPPRSIIQFYSYSFKTKK